MGGGGPLDLSASGNAESFTTTPACGIQIVEDGSARYVAQENITEGVWADDDDDGGGGEEEEEEDLRVAAAFLKQESLGRYFCRRERLVRPAPAPGVGASAGAGGRAGRVGTSRWRFVPSEEVAAEYPDSVSAMPGAAF